MTNVKKVLQVAYHRNGICGAPFHAILFQTDHQVQVNGVDRDATFLATVFEEPDHCAVICVDLLEGCGVTFTNNSWRGDHFEPELRAAIAAYHKETDHA